MKGKTKKIVVVNKMKKKITEIKNNLQGKLSKVVMGATLAMNTVAMNTTTVFANNGNSTGVDTIDFGIGKLIGLFTGIAAGYGIIRLVRNAIDFFDALSDRDAGTMKQSGLGMLSGFGIASIGAVLTYLGFTW